MPRAWQLFPRRPVAFPSPSWHPVRRARGAGTHDAVKGGGVAFHHAARTVRPFSLTAAGACPRVVAPPWGATAAAAPAAAHSGERAAERGPAFGPTGGPVRRTAPS